MLDADSMKTSTATFTDVDSNNENGGRQALQEKLSTLCRKQ